MEEPTDEPDIAPTPNLEERPSKLTLNKNGKPRKQLDQNALERLAKAREKANAIRKQNTVKKLEQKVEKMKVNNQDIAGNQIDPPECATDPQDLGGNVVEQEPEVKVEKIKTKSKKKPQIIVEQSSDDEDEFQENDRVIFVKRVTRKKKEPEPEPPPVVRQEAEPPPDVPKPKPNPLQRQYDAMFSGSFLNQPRRR